jgi:phosphate transport system permease protein
LPELRYVKEKLFLAIVAILTVLGLAPVFHVLASVFYYGAQAVAKHGVSILLNIGTRGGIAQAIVGSVVLSVLATVIGAPLAFIVAVFTVEFRDTLLAKAVKAVAQSLLEVPTVLLGMLVYMLIVVPTRHYSLIAGAIALALVMLPYVLIHVEQALSSVPQLYREAAYAIGMNRAQTLFDIVVDIARRGVATGVLMGFAKAMGETAPLLFTVGAARSSIPCSITDPGDAIPLMIFHYAQMPQRYYHDLAWAGALILVTSFLLIFIAVRWLVGEVKY